MSLIQDALRRKEQEAAKKKPRDEDVPPAPPSDPPKQTREPVVHDEPAGEQPSPHSRGPSVLGVLSAVLIVLIVLSSLGYFLWDALYARRPDRGTAAEAVPADEVIADTALPELPEEDAAPPEAVAALPEIEATEETGPTDFVEVPPSDVVADAVREAVAGGAVPEKKHVRIRTAWPVLEVSGVFPAREPGQASAIINGKLIPVNESLSEATLLSVNANGIVMRYEGEEAFIAMGQTAADRRSVEREAE